MTTDGAHETREEEATGARPVLPVSLQQPPESSPHGATVQATDRISTWLSRIQSLAGLEALVLGTAAIVSASIGQHILTPGDRPIANPDILGATRWYAIGIVLLIFGWWGTYRNRSLLRFPAIGSWLPRLDSLQLVLVACGILWNVLSLLVLRRNWASVPGGVLWLGSLAFLAAAFLRENVGPAPIAEDPEPDRWRIPQRVELIIFLAIMVLAFVMRAWRLGDLTPGMHGDEGEVGTDALGILHGDPAPLFERGWFNQPNMYYWSLAVFMKVFGTGLVGLRSFVVFCGLVTVLFTYLLGREMFGQRGAIIAGSFMAFQSAGLIFSRQEFSNGAIPALLAMAFYFVVRGLRTRKHLDFVIAGFASGFSLYYFAGGRLTPLVVFAVFPYLAVFHPRFVKHYWSRVAAFGLGLLTIAMPFLAYYVAFPINGRQYPNDRFIWLHHADLALKYGTSDWRTILWRQLQATLSIITQSFDVSAMGALSYPIARPIEAVLVVLGLAWAAWRTLDTRFFILSVWFWSAIIVGGVLTIDAPNLPRIMAMLPVLPLAIAGLLDHFAVLCSTVYSKLAPSIKWKRRALWAGAPVVAIAVALAGAENWHMYIGYYLNTHQNPVVTGQAAYVQQEGTRYRFYGMGAPIIYWTHGDNRFINPHADGVDAGNVPSYLPIVDNGSSGEKDANFLVWPPTYDYLSVLHAYYPHGRSRTVPLGDAEHITQPLIGFVVPHAQIDAHRVLTAHFTDASGKSLSQRETSVVLAAGSLLPGDLHYPVRATLTGDLVAPAYSVYSFRITGGRNSLLILDGVRVVSASSSATPTLVLASGQHALRLSATLPSRRAVVRLLWASAGDHFSAIPRRDVWDGHIGRAWLGTIGPEVASHGSISGSVLERRVDGFLGFRNLGQLFGPGPLGGSWSSVLTVRRAGLYGFALNVDGEATMTVDSHTIIHQIIVGAQPQMIPGSVYLKPGPHRLTIHMAWPGPFDYLEAYWTPPGQTQRMLITPDLRPPGPAVWQESGTPAAG